MTVIIFEFIVFLMLPIGLGLAIYWATLIEIPEWLFVVIVSIASLLFIFGGIGLILQFVKFIATCDIAIIYS